MQGLKGSSDIKEEGLAALVALTGCHCIVIALSLHCQRIRRLATCSVKRSLDLITVVYLRTCRCSPLAKAVPTYPVTISKALLVSIVCDSSPGLDATNFTSSTTFQLR